MISADPNRTAEHPLESDPNKKFVCRFMSLREHQKIDDLLGQAQQAQSEREAGDKLLEAIGVGVIDWKGFDKPYSLDAVAETLTPDEVTDLAVNYRFTVRATERDLKNSRRESSSSEKVPVAVESPKPAA